jgi:hypothetical protein
LKLTSKFQSGQIGGFIYNILCDISKLDLTNSTTYGQLFAEALGFDPNDKVQTLYVAAEIIQLFLNVKEDILKAGLNPQIYLEPLNGFDFLFDKLFTDTSVSGRFSSLPSTSMQALLFCADNLSRINGDNNINEEEVNQIFHEVETLCSQVVDSDLPQELKSLLIENLEAIRKSIINYKIWGIEGLKKTLESSIGSVMYNGTVIKDKTENPIVKQFFFNN